MFLEYFCSAVIVAGGSGKRMGTSVAKQYLELCGKTIIERSTDAFLNSQYIDEIILVVPEKDIDYCKGIFKDKKIKIIAGGAERYDSVYNGIKALSDKCKYVVIHDGVRPLVTDYIIEDAIKTAFLFGGGIAGVKAKDTVKLCDHWGFVEETPQRDNVYIIQTPQAFDRQAIEKAYKKAFETGEFGTDDSYVAEKAGVTVVISEGSYENIKITTQEDLLIGERILESRREHES